jgi:hypothetical protein
MSRLIERLKAINCILVGILLLEISPALAIAGETTIRVENVRAEHVGGQIVVYYDLSGPTDEGYIVTMSVRREGSQIFDYKLKNVTGDVGEGLFAGKDRKIVWDIQKEFPAGLEGEDYYFLVEAEIVSSGISPWVWIGGGVAVAGVAGLLLFSKKAESAATTTDTGFPPEPGRP